MAQILIVKPKALNAADKKLLRESGVVCIEATDPSSVRMLMPEGPPLDSSDLFRAAMKAIAADKYTSNTAEGFAKNVAAMLKAADAT